MGTVGSLVSVDRAGSLDFLSPCYLDPTNGAVWGFLEKNTIKMEVKLFEDLLGSSLTFKISSMKSVLKLHLLYSFFFK